MKFLTHDLGQQLEACSDHGLTSNNSSQNCNNKTEVKCSRRDSVEERVRIGSSSSILGDVGCLANVCKKQTGEGEAQPRQLNSSLAESSQIRKQSFNSSESKQKSTKRSPSLFLVAHKVHAREVGTEGLENGMVIFG